jgi:hypothetical protein
MKLKTPCIGPARVPGPAMVAVTRGMLNISPKVQMATVNARGEPRPSGIN